MGYSQTDKTVFVSKKGSETVDAVNLEAYSNENPCRYHKKYKGVRQPLCMCRPCILKYLDTKLSKGFIVVGVPFSMTSIFCE